MRIVSLILIFIFFSCEDAKDKVQTEVNAQSEEIDFLNFANGVFYSEIYSIESLYVDLYRSSMYHESQFNNTDSLELGLLNEIKYLNNRVKITNGPLKLVEYSNDSLLYYLDSWKSMQIPFQEYAWLLRLKNLVEKFDVNKDWSSLLKLNVWLINRYDKPRSNHYYNHDYERESSAGNLVLISNRKDSVFLANAFYKHSKSSIILKSYSEKGEFLAKRFYPKVDSIVLENKDSNILYVLNYSDRNGFKEYFTLGKFQDKTILKIVDENEPIIISDWMRDYIEHLFITSFSYDYNKFNQIYSLKSVFEYDFYGNHSKEKLKEVWSDMYKAFYQGTSFSGGDVLDTNSLINKEDIDVAKYFIREMDKSENLNRYEYFGWLRVFIVQMRSKISYCGSDPMNHMWSVFKINNDEGYPKISIFMGDLYPYYVNKAVRKYAKDVWRKELDKLNFPLPGYSFRRDGTTTPVDSIYREDLFFYSTN